MHLFCGLSRKAFPLAIVVLLILSFRGSAAFAADVAEDNSPHVVWVVVLNNSPPLQYYDPVAKKAAGFAVDIFDEVARLKGRNNFV